MTKTIQLRWLIAVALAAAFSAQAQIPPGYYAAAEGKAGPELRAVLHAIIRNHNVIPYSSGTKFDTSDALAVLDEDPANTNNVIGIYSRASEPKSSFGLSTGWNREHQWCDSYGLDGREPAYSDLFNLRAEDENVNSARGNKFYDVSDPANPSYKFPAHAEAPLCSTDSDSWEPPVEVRGDIARALFYMATRYAGDAPNEPALYLTDATGLISSTTNLMGRLSTLLKWNHDDPVSAAEQRRNDLIYSLYQTNRNPFVDHPEWVDLTFAPLYTNAPVLNFQATAQALTLLWLATNQSTRLEWTTNLPAGWSDVPAEPVLTNGQFRVVWTNAATLTFFRLRAM